MPRPAISSTPAARRQNLLVEFASLKHAAPPGIYMSLSPNDPMTWWGVIFVRKGPYRGGIFKFTINFPERYPSTAPTITFHTSIYHPLIAPHTPSSIIPGAFSLRHGFPHWFTDPSVSVEPTTLDILEYLKATLSDHRTLDAIPLAAAENPAAWKAWSSEAHGGTGGWDERVKVAVEASGSEGALYGSGGRGGDEPVGCFLVGRVGLGVSMLHRRKWIADLRHGVMNEQIRFVEMDEGVVEEVKVWIRRAVEERGVVVVD